MSLKSVYTKLQNQYPNDYASWLDYASEHSGHSQRRALFESLPENIRMNIYKSHMLDPNSPMYEGYIGNGMSLADYENTVITNPESYELFLNNARWL